MSASKIVIISVAVLVVIGFIWWFYGKTRPATNVAISPKITPQSLFASVTASQPTV